MPSVLGGFLDALGQREAAQSERAAQRENERRAREDRDYLERLFAQQRSLQFGGDEGRFIQGANQIWDATGAMFNPATALSRYQDLTAGGRSAAQGATRTVGDIFSGKMTSESLASAQPVFAARRNVATGQRQGIKQGLSAIINRLDAANARGGYGGTGSGNVRNLARVSIGANQQAADVMTRAELENAMQQAAIEEEGRRLQVESIGLPSYVAQQEIGLDQLPQSSLVQAYMQRLQPYSFLRTGDVFPYGAVPRTPPRVATPSTAQLMWGAGAQAADSIADAALSYASMGCWVAREVYGANNPKWLLFRDWMFTKAPERLLRKYLKYGERLAKWISDKPKIIALIRSEMDAILKGAY